MKKVPAILLLLVVGLYASCTSQEDTDRAKIVNAQDARPGKDGEAAVPPNAVTGAYLLCEEVANPLQNNPVSKVKCALRNQASNQKIDLANDFALYQWNQANKPENFVNVNYVELAQDPEWHVAYTLTGRTPADVQNFKRSKNLSLNLDDKSGSSHTFISVSPAYSIRWQVLNGEAIPANAIAAGTESKGQTTLFLCRSFVKNQVMPGKMVSVVAGPSRSSCFTSDIGVSQASVDQTGRVAHFYEVLVLDNIKFAEVLEWVPATNGQHPTLAVLTGSDLAGAVSYTCRALAVNQFNAPQGEMTPGQLRSGSDSCEYESFGAFKATQYEVLAYKSEAVKAMFERVDK